MQYYCSDKSTTTESSVKFTYITSHEKLSRIQPLVRRRLARSHETGSSIQRYSEAESIIYRDVLRPGLSLLRAQSGRLADSLTVRGWRLAMPAFI